ncbi:hypothetical protein BVG19_g1829 [[Candida] boidinii]|nr:hypothetical protein BVG19_g1829 [[Candida] boidinii]OWB53176.1 hypothetical protein B5S27_g4768 [[Candida] boidinii]OWB68984.1 hypothetical protein B5S30_g4378 [[Candida] boidinii]
MLPSIPPEVSEALSQLLSGLSSANNSIRSAAEESLNKEWCKKDRIDVLLMFLALSAAQGSPDTVRQFAAVLFRRLAIKSPNEQGYSVTARQIDHVSQSAKIEIRNTLLQGFMSQQSNNVRHKIADAIAEISKNTSTEWPELLPTIFSSSTNSDPSFRESAFRIITTSPEIISSHHLEDSLKMFHSGFEDQNDDVRIAACSAFVSFFENLNKSKWPSLSPLLPNLLNSLPRLLENGKETALASVIESLIELVEIAPKMFKPMFSTIIDFCSQVAKNRDLESSARLSALELLTTFCEVSPNMCKRESSYAGSMVLVTLQMMTEVCLDDEDCAEWNNADDIQDEEDEEEYNAARQSLDRVSLKLGGQTLAAPLFQYLPQMLQSSDWHERQASLMALSSATEGCRDVLISEIPKILDLILPHLQDPHPRVQYACCNAVGQISTDFADTIQRTSGDRILPAMIAMLTTKNVPRVQTHAAAALVNFSENASKEVLEPYLDSLLTNLLELLQGPKRYVQEQVVTTIAIIADAAETKFIKYYDTLMPLLINVLKADMGEQNRVLRAKSIECATLIALAVGKEKFAPNASEIIEIFGHLQQTLLGEDDPIKPYLEQGWERVCKLVGKDFIPYLPLVLPPLLEAGKATQDISVVDDDELEEINQNEEFQVIQLAGKHIAVHTAVLDDKAAAIELLKNYADTLGADFFPYVESIASDIIIPGLDFYLHDGVRGAAALTMPSLLSCTIAATGANDSFKVQALWKGMCDKLIHQLGNDPVPELLVAYYTAFSQCIELIGPNALTDEQIASIGNSIDHNLKETYERIIERESGDDEYTEENEEDDEEYTDEELLDEISKGINVVFKNTKLRFLPAFQKLVPTIAAFINDENSSLKLLALCSISDLIEFTGAESFNLKDLFMQPVGESLTSPSSMIRQAAAYCVGVAAQFGGPSFKEFCFATLPSLLQMVSVPDARANDNINATENIIAAIAKICHTYNNEIPDFQNLAERWLKLLPVLNDEEAAPYAYSFLAELIDMGFPPVSQNIPKIVDDVVQALLYHSLSGKSAERVVQSVKQLLGTIPQAEAMGILNGYSAEAQQEISKWFS